MRRASLVQLCALVLLASPALADKPTRCRACGGKGDIPGNAVYIANSAAQTLQFQLRCGSDGDWTPFGLPAGSGDVFQGCERFSFQLRTNESRQVKYVLEPPDRYELFWNAGSERWDLSVLGPAK